MSSQTDASGSSDGIGSRLKEARERAGLSLIEAAERLHVDPRAIEALEGERFDEFGASVYVRGHIGHYAELVGESPAELQGLYARSSHAVRAPDLTRGPYGRSTSPSPAPLVPGIAVVVAVALVGFSWWVAGNLHESPKVQPPALPVASAAPGTAQDAIAGGTSAAMPAAAVSPGKASAQAPAKTPLRASLATRTSTPATAPLADAAGSVRSIAQAPSADEAAHPALAASGDTGPGGAGAALARRSAEGRSKLAALQLHFTEDSWAEVYDARGERLFFDVGSADSTRTVSGMPPLRIVLGNPTGVALELNGRPVGEPENATRNVSIEFQINRSGRVAPARLAAADARSEQKEPGRD
jgi:cytoskeleton protein RodZ